MFYCFKKKQKLFEGKLEFKEHNYMFYSYEILYFFTVYDLHIYKRIFPLSNESWTPEKKDRSQKRESRVRFQ